VRFSPIRNHTTTAGPALKPDVEWLLAACGLDFTFERAEGDYLFYRDRHGEMVPLLDFLGGFGASLFGHNHPDLVATAQRVLADARPFNAQGSIRSTARALADRLSQSVERSTGAHYVVTLASTGAEAVEAAIKHAALELTTRREADRRRTDDHIREARSRVRDGTASVSDAFLRQAVSLLGVSPESTLDSICAVIRARAEAIVESTPVFLALEGAFHGKTSGALCLTHNPEFRAPWQHLTSMQVVFLKRDDPAAVWDACRAARDELVELACSADGTLHLDVRGVSRVAACFAEPMQGEGGIREISRDYLATLRAAADEHGFPLVFDEIQSGMGRTGTLLASEPSGVVADYYLFSKALGGGLAKVAAMLVDSRRYVDGFGLLHTSTFADDDLSSAIALKALDLLEQHNGALMRRCGEAGDRLLRGLADLARRFPDQLADVRGRGLMVGIELGESPSPASPLLRVAADQHLLTYLVASYLAHVHGIRVGPTLSSHNTIRIEPSALVADADIDRFLAAFERVLEILADADVATLVAHLVDDEQARGSPGRGDSSVAHRPVAAGNGNRPRVGFLVHFMEPGDVAEWEPRLAVVTPAGQQRLLSRLRGLLAPFVVDRTALCSATGAAVDLVVIGVPFTPEQALDSLRMGLPWATDLVKAARDLARDEGCRVLGLGGYTSIVTDNGRDLVDDRMAVTSGNSLTVAAAVEALLLSAARQQIDLSSARLGVLGAAGNIGAALAELAAEHVAELLLIGRHGAARLLVPVVDAIYASEFRRLAGGAAPTGIAARIAATDTVRAMLAEGAPAADCGGRIRCGLQEELGADAPIRLSHEISDLRSCALVASATNSPRPIIESHHLGDGAVVVCDIAVPQDVHSSVAKARPNAAILRGGIIRAPAGQNLRLPGARLDDGEIYACLAEAALLGLAGCTTHYSRGPLTIAAIRRVHELARQHGFSIAERLVR
jgi:acetylornithine/succinyldiaminopimelate/putrescine aminotransferase/predicted amino acid dehydrogenase